MTLGCIVGVPDRDNCSIGVQRRRRRLEGRVRYAVKDRPAWLPRAAVPRVHPHAAVPWRGVVAAIKGTDRKYMPVGTQRHRESTVVVARPTHDVGAQLAPRRAVPLVHLNVTSVDERRRIAAVCPNGHDRAEAIQSHRPALIGVPTLTLKVADACRPLAVAVVGALVPRVHARETGV